MDTTTLLKKSIAYEQSKTDVLNLATHKRQDLSVLIEVIDNERAALSHMIESNLYLIDNNEDLEEGLEKKMRETIATYRAKLETLIAWRFLFLSAWQQVKK